MKLYIVSVGSKIVHDGYVSYEQGNEIKKQLKDKGYKQVWVIQETEPDPTEQFKMEEMYV